MDHDVCRRNVVAVNVAELNLDRISCSTLHSLRRIVEQTDVEAHTQRGRIAARSGERSTTELSRDRESLRCCSTRQSVVCCCHATHNISDHRQTNDCICRVCNCERHRAFVHCSSRGRDIRGQYTV